MKVVDTLKDLHNELAGLARPVGFVPTMGYLHEGHLSLVRQARLDCKSVVASIYVNPSQFGPQEDLSKYPRDMKRDLGLLREEGVDLVWTPDDRVMYSAGYQTWVTVEQVTQTLEGVFRPTHFRGVATVVAKLFNAVQPQKAYFGQKDAQQAVVIRTMGRDLNFPIEIIVCPIVREPDGLAMSSRNVYLSQPERLAATALSRGLFRARDRFAVGEHEAARLRQIIMDSLATEPLIKVQYVSCANPETLQELEGRVEHALLSLAVKIGNTHLIDNVIV